MKRRQQLWLMLAAAASAETITVRLGYFGEAQPFQVACARGWFDVEDGGDDFQVVCLPQSSGGFAVAKLDDGDLDVALLGSTPAATGLARGVRMQTFYVAHMKGTSQGLLVDPDIIGSPLDLDGRTIGTPFGYAAKKISAVSRVAAKERPRHLPRFLDLALVAHDLNQRAQARIATAARDIMEEEAGGATLAKLASFDLGDHHQPALRSKSLHAFKDEVGGAALEVELDAAVCVETLHALATAAFPAFRAALEKLFPPGTEGVELECDADFAVKSPARMRAKVDEYRRENETVWPRAKRLSDCLRASRTVSVVTADAARTVAAYEALSDSGAFTIVRLKNKLAEHAKPYCMHVNLKFQAPGLAAMTVEVQIVPKAIYSDQKTSHRLYTVARANSYAAYRGLAEEDSDDDDDDDADVAGDEEDLGVLTPTDARSPAEVPVWKFWARE